MGESLSIAIITVSDTRTEANDTSGDFLVEALQEAGHQLSGRSIVVDDRFLLRAALSNLIADPNVQVVLMTIRRPLAAGLNSQTTVVLSKPKYRFKK